MSEKGPQDCINVLFLCTGNSARSILAEAILDEVGGGKFIPFSAGSVPTGTVNPHALSLLEQRGHPTARLRSKSWDAFAGPQAPVLDFIFTVCDNAGKEVCPVWPGQPVSAHWGIPDPAMATGTDSEIGLAFSEAYRLLRNRISIFVNLPISALDKLSLQRRLNEIGQEMLESENTA